MRLAQQSAGGARGVSFVELLLVVALMVTLTALVLPTGRTVNRRIQEKQLERALLTIRQAIDEYRRDWVRGCIESEEDHGWPEDLEALTMEIERQTEGNCASIGPAKPPSPERDPTDGPATEQKIYLPRIPKDPFNRHDDEWDVSGWRARSYEDEPDSRTWDEEGVYDVRSGSEWTALDGTKYEEW